MPYEKYEFLNLQLSNVVGLQEFVTASVYDILYNKACLLKISCLKIITSSLKIQSAIYRFIQFLLSEVTLGILLPYMTIYSNCKEWQM